MPALTQSSGGPASSVLAKNGADDWGELSRGERCLVPRMGVGNSRATVVTAWQPPSVWAGQGGIPVWRD